MKSHISVSAIYPSWKKKRSIVLRYISAFGEPLLNSCLIHQNLGLLGICFLSWDYHKLCGIIKQPLIVEVVHLAARSLNVVQSNGLHHRQIVIFNTGSMVSTAMPHPARSTYLDNRTRMTHHHLPAIVAYNRLFCILR
jgi:hypothetical protein